MGHTRAYARTGEQTVARYLEQHGYTICTMNFTTRQGEVDIIARDTDMYLFVEVKARKHPRFATTTTITPRKQHKIIQAASQYIQQHHISGYTFRFDVAIVSGTDDVSYIPHAFSPEDSII